MPTPFLSKSRIQSGRQCPKRLWLELHEPQAAAHDADALLRMQQGTRFGELARDLLGGGTLIAADYMHAKEALAQTQAALGLKQSQVPRLFEAAFEFNGVRVRVDVFERGADGNTLIEVKSSTSVKDEHLWDCAIQTFVAWGAGRRLKRVVLAHVDNTFVYRTASDYSGLLTLEDVTEKVMALLPNMPRVVEDLKRVAVGPMPELATGPQCKTPYACPFLEHCQAAEPERPAFPVELLPYGKSVVKRLRAAGYADLRDVPDTELTNPKHQRIAATTRNGKAFVSAELPGLLAAIAYPRYYLDFETIGYVVPRWLGTRPYQQVPFQFSCHIETAPGILRHESFLDLSGDLPLAAFADRLLEVLGEEGPVLVWNQSFEAGKVKELAECFPKKRRALLHIVERMLDLLPIYRDHYYHRDMLASWSIKKVLPTIAPDLHYSNLAVGDGNAAQSAYVEAIALDTTTARKQELREQLLAYCERDTLAMVQLAHPDFAH